MTLTGKYYFWNVDHILEVEPYKGNTAIDLLCVDDCTTNPAFRYGKYILGESGRHVWIHVDLEYFPPAFKMALLLLGVE